MRALPALRRAALVAAVLVVVGCGKQDVYSGLTETEANEITAVLLSNGIKAVKTTMGEKGSTVSVDPDQFLVAVKVLRDAGLPRPVKDDLGTIFKKSGITSTPFEERVRFAYGLSQEIEKTINAIDGVIVSRVHLVLPDAPEFGREVKPSSASVLIKYRPGTDIEFLAPQVRRLVSNAIEGLNYAAVNVTTVEAQPATSAFRTENPARLPREEAGLTRLLGDWRNVALLLIALGAVGWGALTGVRYLRTRETAKASSEKAGED